MSPASTLRGCCARVFASSCLRVCAGSRPSEQPSRRRRCSGSALSRQAAAQAAAAARMAWTDSDDGGWSEPDLSEEEIEDGEEVRNAGGCRGPVR